MIGIVENKGIRDFLLGGKCDCIIENLQSRERFIFEITKSSKNDKMYFIKSVTGVGNIYGGYLLLKEDGSIVYNQGPKGQIPENDARIQSVLYVLTHYESLPPYILVQHMGKCSRCRRKLTDPESIRRGLGPECAKKV